jgi:hypothetical protein
MYDATVLADSISPAGKRLTTVSLTFPRFILAEVNTHCRFSRNSASSRAIPPEVQLEQLKENPFVPEMFYKRVKGMGRGIPLDEIGQKLARRAWLRGRDDAVTALKELIELEVSKEHCNRLVEPYLWHTAIITSTEWENYNALRIPPSDESDTGFPAQIEFQKIGILHRKAMRESTPRLLDWNEWHVPLTTSEDFEWARGDWDKLCMISAGRCAKISYVTHENPETADQSIARANSLLGSGHMSPFMHQGRPWDHRIDTAAMCGNFELWVQLRKTILNEHNAIGVAADREAFDPRYPDSIDREMWSKHFREALELEGSRN